MNCLGINPANKMWIIKISEKKPPRKIG
jgi:hypothetical protein